MRGRQPSPSPVVKGDPPLKLLAERPRALHRDHLLLQQPLLPQPSQERAGAARAFWNKGRAQGCCLQPLPWGGGGSESCGCWRSPGCDSLGRQNWRESSGEDREVGRCCCGPAHIVPCDASTGERSREGGQVTGTLQTLLLLLLCPWHIPGQGPAFPAILAKGQSHSSSASSETAAGQAELSTLFPLNILRALGGNFLLHRNFQTCPLVPER